MPTSDAPLTGNDRMRSQTRCESIYSKARLYKDEEISSRDDEEMMNLLLTDVGESCCGVNL